MKSLCRIRVCVVPTVVLLLSLPLVMLIKAEISTSEITINEFNKTETEDPEEVMSHELGLNNTTEAPATSQPSKEMIPELIAANAILASQIANLESRVRDMSCEKRFQVRLRERTATMEIQYVDMQVVQWEEAVKRGLQNVAISFQAGYSIGAISSWEFSLTTENGAITANLLLIEERYNREALFAGFTAYVLNNIGNVHSQANALPVNFLDGSGRTLHLPNVVTLAEIRNSSNGLSEADVFRIRFRLELLGVGHKLYLETSAPPEPPSKDIQTVIFDVEDILMKIAQIQNDTRNESLLTHHGDKKPLTYTRFVLRHDLWYLNTNWTVELRDEDNGDSISLDVILENCKWPELHASFKVEVWDINTKVLIQTQGTPINNFVKDRITIDPLLIVSQLKEMYEDGDKPALQFKLQFVVYGKYARYYRDIV